MLTLSNLGVMRQSKRLFTNLGISLFPGAVLIINGGNGSGKTSLLRMIAALISQYNGEIFYNGFKVAEHLDEYHQLLSYIPHEDVLIENFTVYENLKFWAEIHDNMLALQAAIHTFSLNNYLDYSVHQLSKGWHKKVLLSKLLLTNSPLWLLDEPYVNLDIAGQEVLNNMITVRCNQGGIVIISSNQPLTLKSPIIINLEDFQ